MRRFVLTKRAERDLDEIKGFITAGAGPKVARRALKNIRNAMKLLGSDPGIGHGREDLTSRSVKFWTVYSYLIVYDPHTEPVQIIRILHGMRDVAEILS